MKKFLFTALSVLSLCACNEAEEMSAYLMVYHRDEDHGLHAAISHDGYSFVALNDDKPIIAGDTIADQHGIRDPHIYRGADGAFYLAMTDLHIYAQREGYRETEWERPGELYGWGNNRGIVLMKSTDLINWKRANIFFDESFESWGEIGCAWAPETIYDATTNQYMLYLTMRKRGTANKLYYCYVNEDYDKLLSEPKILFEYPDTTISAIDGDITRVGDTYHLCYVSHDGTPGIKHATSESPTGPWTYYDEWIDKAEPCCEAPHVFKRIGEEKWVLMYDIYCQKPMNFGFAETTDFKTFEDLGEFNKGVMKMTPPNSPKHGAVVQLTAEEAARLEAKWN